MNTNIVAYYKDRAQEYEKIYAKPERQDDLQRATTIVRDIFAGKQVLEIACGTGYWTERIAQRASSIFATDINEAVIDVAKSKTYQNSNISFGLADIYNFPDQNQYEGLFAGFIWSHILLQDLDKFLQTVNRLVVPGGTVVFMDNHFVANSNHPITNIDEQGNTFQTRKLEDGTEHLVLKNFPTAAFLNQKLDGHTNAFEVINLTYYWILIYTIPSE